MKKPSLSVLIAASVCLHLCFSEPAAAQFGGLKDLKKAAEKGGKKVFGDDKQDASKAEKQAEGSAGASPTAQNAIVFSESPLDPAQPANLTTSFKTPGYIYGLIQVDKTWRDLLGKGNQNATKVEVPVDLLIDGNRTEFQYITIKKPEAMDSKYLVFDIAPDPAKMTAYKDPGFFYAEGKGNRKIGPDTYTFNLAQLSPGKHTIRFQVRSYGDILSAGEFTIEADDYGFYAALREKVLQEAFAVATMPKAQKTDKQLEATMHKLLENAGWSDIRKLVIVDKDWWIDRVAGGDSAVQSRHIAAAVAAPADDGTFFWCVCTFHEQKLLDGSFGPLELTHTGEKKPILEENIDK